MVPHPLHLGHEVSVVRHWKVCHCVGPVFEDSPLGGLKIVEMPSIVLGAPRPENMVMGSLHDGDRVDLYVAETLDGFSHAFHAGRESLRAVEELGTESYLATALY